MAKYIHLAREYFNEGEMRDLLSHNKIGKKTLHEISRERKVIFSADADAKSLSNNLARMFFDWNEFISVTEKLDQPKLATKKRPLRLGSKLSHSQISSGITALEGERGDEKGENYSLKKTGPKSYSVEATYIDINCSKAKHIRRVEVTSVIEVNEKSDGKTEIFYDGEERSEDIARALIGQIRLTNSTLESADLKEVSVEALSSAKRTKFFLSLIAKTKGLELQSVLTVKLERPNDNKDTDAKEHQVSGNLQNALLKGENILETNFYQDLVGADYFISSIQWTFLDGSKNQLVNVEAGFKLPKEGKDFYIDVSSIFDAKDVDFVKVPRKAFQSEKDRYTDLISETAYGLI